MKWGKKTESAAAFTRKMVGLAIRNAGVSVPTARLPPYVYENEKVGALVGQKSALVQRLGGLSMKHGGSKMLNTAYGKYRNLVNVPVYNASRNTILTNKNARQAVRRSVASGIILDMVEPIAGKGGINSKYINYALNKRVNPRAYAIVNGNGRKTRAFILWRNTPKYRYVNVLAGKRTYGAPIMARMIANSNKNIRLQAVREPGLLRFYSRFGFVPVRAKYSKNLVPMIRRHGRRASTRSTK
jgi:hypothetical protein